MALVQEYAASQSEPAFATLVLRHLALVHSAALRQVGDAHLAKDVAQAVFIILAHKAGSLDPDTILSAWLYRTTRYVAAETLRTRRRRAQPEQGAYMQSTLHDPQAEAWKHLSPLLDEAMSGLSARDRAALVLRYFENKTAPEIASALKVNEEAAQKRVTRALEKLKAVFRKRGVSSTTALIAGAISAHSVQAAPPALSETIAMAAMTKGAAAGCSTLTLVKEGLKLMTWTRTKSAIILAIIVVLLGTGAMIVILAKSKNNPNQATAKITNWASGTSRAGRQVKASGDLALGILVEGDTVTVRLGEPRVDAAGQVISDHTLIFKTQQVLLDGKERATC